MEQHTLLPLFKIGGLFAGIEHRPKEIRQFLHPRDQAHMHRYCELYFNISGLVSFAVENKIYPVEAGDVIITKPNEIHYCIYRADGVHDCYCLWLYAEEGFLPLLAPFFEREKGSGNHLRLSRENQQKLLRLLETALQEQENNRPDSITRVAAVMEILALLEKQKINTRSAALLPPLLLKMLAYTDAHFTEDCSAGKLCEVFFVSRSTVDRLFRKNLDITPAKYLENRRLAHAKSLLEQCESVQTVCEKCGFPDYSHFIALFKKRFGVTPRQYQKKANGKHEEGI